MFLHLFKFNEDWGDFVDSIYRVDSNLIGWVKKVKWNPFASITLTFSFFFSYKVQIRISIRISNYQGENEFSNTFLINNISIYWYWKDSFPNFKILIPANGLTRIKCPPGDVIRVKFPRILGSIRRRIRAQLANAALCWHSPRGGGSRHPGSETRSDFLSSFSKKISPSLIF